LPAGHELNDQIPPGDLAAQACDRHIALRVGDRQDVLEPVWHVAGI
jgi:hypothetical protein